MRLRNYSEEYIKEQMDDFQDFVESVDEYTGINTFSINTVATLYIVMRRETRHENCGYSGY